MASVVPTASGTPAEEIITETNTPTIKETVKVTEPIKTAELLALEKQLALEREKKEKAQAKIIADMEELLKLANDSDDDLSEEEQLKANDELPTDADKKKLKK
jgi:CHASE3 domain sensor protein